MDKIERWVIASFDQKLQYPKEAPDKSAVLR